MEIHDRIESPLWNFSAADFCSHRWLQFAFSGLGCEVLPFLICNSPPLLVCSNGGLSMRDRAYFVWAAASDEIARCHSNGHTRTAWIIQPRYEACDMITHTYLELPCRPV